MNISRDNISRLSLLFSIKKKEAGSCNCMSLCLQKYYLLRLTDGPHHFYLPLPHDCTVNPPRPRAISAHIHQNHPAKKLGLFKLLPHAEKIQFTYVKSPLEEVILPFTERKTDTISAFTSITPAVLQQNSYATRQHLALVKSHP